MSWYRIGDIHSILNLSDFTPTDCTPENPNCNGVIYRATNRFAKIKSLKILTNRNDPNPRISIEIQFSLINAETIVHQLNKLTKSNGAWEFPLVSPGGMAYHIDCDTPADAERLVNILATLNSTHGNSLFSPELITELKKLFSYILGKTKSFQHQIPEFKSVHYVKSSSQGFSWKKLLNGLDLDGFGKFLIKNPDLNKMDNFGCNALLATFSKPISFTEYVLIYNGNALEKNIFPFYDAHEWAYLHFDDRYQLIDAFITKFDRPLSKPKAIQNPKEKIEPVLHFDNETNCLQTDFEFPGNEFKHTSQVKLTGRLTPDEIESLFKLMFPNFKVDGDNQGWKEKLATEFEDNLARPYTFIDLISRTDKCGRKEIIGFQLYHIVQLEQAEKNVHIYGLWAYINAKKIDIDGLMKFLLLRLGYALEKAYPSSTIGIALTSIDYPCYATLRGLWFHPHFQDEHTTITSKNLVRKVYHDNKVSIHHDGIKCYFYEPTVVKVVGIELKNSLFENHYYGAVRKSVETDESSNAGARSVPVLIPLTRKTNNGMARCEQNYNKFLFVCNKLGIDLPKHLKKLTPEFCKLLQRSDIHIYINGKEATPCYLPSGL